MAAKRAGTEGEAIRIEHLTNSLGQIEVWLQAVRAALERLDPKQEVPLRGELARQWSEEFVGIAQGKDCPPPNGEDDDEEAKPGSRSRD